MESYFDEPVLKRFGEGFGEALGELADKAHQAADELKTILGREDTRYKKFRLCAERLDLAWSAIDIMKSSNLAQQREYESLENLDATIRRIKELARQTDEKAGGVKHILDTIEALEASGNKDFWFAHSSMVQLLKQWEHEPTQGIPWQQQDDIPPEEEPPPLPPAPEISSSGGAGAAKELPQPDSNKTEQKTAHAKSAQNGSGFAARAGAGAGGSFVTRTSDGKPNTPGGGTRQH